MDCVHLHESRTKVQCCLASKRCAQCHTSSAWELFLCAHMRSQHIQMRIIIQDYKFKYMTNIFKECTKATKAELLQDLFQPLLASITITNPQILSNKKIAQRTCHLPSCSACKRGSGWVREHLWSPVKSTNFLRQSVEVCQSMSKL